MLVITCFSILSYRDFQEFFSSSHCPLLQSFPVGLSCDAITLLDRYFSSRCWSGNFAKVHECGQRILKEMSHTLRRWPR